MSSEQRSNSAVRSLRSIFEQQASENSPAARGRSPGLGSDLNSDRPRSKVRASFFAVEPTRMASPAPAAQQQNGDDNGAPIRRDSSAGLRRPSFSGGQDGDVVAAMKETVADEAERRENESSVADTIPEAAVESAAPTPLVEVNKQLGGSGGSRGSGLRQDALKSKLEKEDKQAENPDKHVTGAEEEPAEMTPADPANEGAVSGGDALPPVAEDLRKPASSEAKKAAAKPGASRTANSAKPASISTKAAPRAATSSVKSPLSPPAASKPAMTKKASRSSLTAPTAASVARAAAANKAAAAASKPKPRETTKPVEVSSRLTAPTAASRARLESTEAAPAPKPSTTSRPAPKTASARPTPRSSLAARPESRTSQTSGKRPAGPVDGSFLERMTRPTAASANRIHEKTEVKSPPRSKNLPLRPKTNGHAKGAKPASSTAATAEAVPDAEGETTIADEEPSFLPEYEQHNTTSAGKSSNNTTTERVEKDMTPSEPVVVRGPVGKGLNPAHDVGKGKGNETPIPQTNGHEDAATLEGTPAGIGGEDSIR